MTYKKKVILFIFWIIQVFSATNSLAQGPDSVYLVPKTPFLAKIISIPNLTTSISLSEANYVIPLKNTILSSNAQQLYKSRDTIYLLIQQTGFVFKLIEYDSTTCVFKRLDHTINLNYNINCKNFVFNNELYSYGGYGFWKANGHLRKFNYQDSEWDIIPANKEIISSYFLWFSESQGRLYVPYQRIVNAGIAGAENVTGVPIYTSYYLDLKTHQWIELGELESDIIKLVKNINSGTGSLSFKDGILFMANDDTFIFDYTNNSVYKSKNADLNQFLIRRHDIADMFIYNNEIHSYNTGTKQFTNYPFKIADFEKLRTGIWGVGSKLYYAIMIVMVIIILVLSGIWFFNRSVNRKLESAQLQLLKNKAVTQAFTGTEVALIHLLLNATLNGKVVEINQINHVLGIKDKNVGLQKKVRSDVMKAINDKYEFITQSNTQLIGSSRKEDDKRFYEYFIASSEVKSIQRILEKNA
jgi:hypothetical protein